MAARAEGTTGREAFFEVFDQTGSLKAAALQVGVKLSAAHNWVARSGRRAWRVEDPRKRDFYRLRGDGLGVRAAAREVGIATSTAYRWDRDVHSRLNPITGPGGVLIEYTRSGRKHGKLGFVPKPRPNQVVIPSKVNDRYLSFQEREDIAVLHHAGVSCTEIARQLGRHKSTVSREVNKHTRDGRYRAYDAHHTAMVHRQRPKASKLAMNPELGREVQQRLAQKHSPVEISRRLVLDFPDDERMRVSHETIYQCVYFQAKGQLKQQVKSDLRSGRTQRKPRNPDESKPSRFKDPMIMISERPAEVEDRAVPGHWEGDLIMGIKNKSAIGTLVERSTRFTMLLHLPCGHSAADVRDAIVKKMSEMPEELRASLTWDQGKEMAEHVSIKMATNMDVYFCDPHSPWQRGTNENTNGLLRQYFPKGTDLSVYSEEDLDRVARELNGRPRMTLEWANPAERMRALLEEHGESTGVATTA